MDEVVDKTVDDNANYSANSVVNRTTTGDAAISDRFKRATKGIDREYRPKRAEFVRGLKPIKVEEKKRRLQIVKDLVDLGMSAEQMQEFLPTWSIPAGRSQVYKYLSEIKTPKKYERSEARQSHHDYFTFRSFIRIAKDAPTPTHSLAKGTAFEGQRFRPDFTFWNEDKLFFIELQLSNIVQTRWRVKFRNYLRMYEDIKRPFRVLFIIDQHKDMSYIRSHARQVLTDGGHPELNLFLFCNLNDFQREEFNVVTDKAWWTTFGGPKERVALIN